MGKQSSFYGLSLSHFFDSIEQFKEALDKAKIVEIDSLGAIHNLTKNDSVDDIKDMVSSYYKPRDVDRIIKGYKERVQMPLPIILKGSKGTWILAGNTRQAIARVMDIIPKALLVSVQN